MIARRAFDWRRAMAAIAVFAILAATALAQPPDRPDPIRIPADGQPLRIERTADIPRQLRAAIDRHRGCRLDDAVMREIPIVVFRPAERSRPIAIVPCEAISGNYSQVYRFERTPAHEPSLIAFPVIARTGGFTSSDRPGLMTWDAATQTLVATEHNDMCPAQVARHTYRHAVRETSGFVLVKVERGERACGGTADWQVMWEAQPWDLGAR